MTGLGDIRKKIKRFLTPEKMKTHGRPICQDDAAACGLCVEKVDLHYLEGKGSGL